MTTIAELVQKDQDNIKKYKTGEVTESEFQHVADEVAGDFFELYKKNGFPRKDDNTSLYKDAVTLALHLPLEKLEEVYRSLKNQPEENVDSKDLAFMVDKIRVNKNKPQLYGTQFKRGGNGTIEFLPIEEAENVDVRRIQVGLEPLEEYRTYAESGG